MGGPGPGALVRAKETQMIKLPGRSRRRWSVYPGMAAVGLVSALSATAWADAVASTKGRVEAVTVYRGQALVTRAVDLAASAGLAEVVVTDLPARVLPGSLYADGGTGVSVRSVQFRTRPVSEDVRDDVRKIDGEIAGLNDRLAELNGSLERLAQQRAYIDKMENFVAPTAQAEMTKGVLNAETLTKLAEFAFQKRDEIGKKHFDISKQARELQGAIDLKTREREKLTAGSVRTVNEAVVFLNKEAAGPATIRVRYLVDSATWSPSYNSRANPAAGEVTLDYFASVEQMSGEDWSGVLLELSTATPALVAKAPLLDPMLVALAVPKPAEADKARYDDLKREIFSKQSALERERNQVLAAYSTTNMPASSAGGGVRDVGTSAPMGDMSLALRSTERGLNDLAGQSQLLDFVAAEKSYRRPDARPQAPTMQEGVSVTYALAGKTTVPSRTDRQLIQIASVPMKAAFAKVATPVLTQFVYDQASLTNTSGMVLLAGPVTSYTGSAFVGSGSMTTIAAGESFDLGFGIDSSLRVGKELVERTESVQGGNRIVELTYRLSAENFGDKPVKIRMSDRFPKSRDNEIRVSMVSSVPQPLSPSADEETGAARDRKNGLVTWEIDAAARALGQKAVGVEYKLRLEFDKQMSLVGVESQIKP